MAATSEPTSPIQPADPHGPPPKPPAPFEPALRRRIRAHLGGEPEQLPLVAEGYDPSEQPVEQ